MTKVLIYGGTGSLGRALIKRFCVRDDIEEVYAYSRDEAKHWTLRNELSSEFPSHKLKFIVGDIRDKKRVTNAIEKSGADAIIIAAALKQVDTCELSPRESIMTNLIGTQNVIESVSEIGRTDRTKRTVLFISTDKACSPVNVYGMCKAISERIVTSMANDSDPNVRYVGVRYGNVLESRGSIIPLFTYQGTSESNTHLTVTHPDMTRFVMTLDDSVDLIQKAFDNATSGDIWIPKLPAMKIGDLAEIFSEIHKKPIKIVGLRPGEKMHEALINESESIRTLSVDNHYVIKPAYSTGVGEQFTYTSADDVMSKQQLYNHLCNLGIFSRPLSSFHGRSIEEIVTK